MVMTWRPISSPSTRRASAKSIGLRGPEKRWMKKTDPSSHCFGSGRSGSPTEKAPSASSLSALLAPPDPLEEPFALPDWPSGDPSQPAETPLPRETPWRKNTPRVFEPRSCVGDAGSGPSRSFWGPSGASWEAFFRILCVRFFFVVPQPRIRTFTACMMN